ncbi:MAG: HNH endonuclease [Dehalococcoidales bacterium]|nr:HNH endonuclease [Dehalococcoidales bacterium]
MADLPVLVLNQNYEPLNICRARRAVVMVYQHKAEMLEDGSGFVHSVSNSYPLPTVIRLSRMIKRPRPQRKVTRLEIFNRDQYTCQYCGKRTQQLTLDHVIPRHQGGQRTWENVVSACIHCNRYKAGRTPQQAGMKLIQHPTPPRDRLPFYIPHHLKSQPRWQKYLPAS